MAKTKVQVTTDEVSNRPASDDDEDEDKIPYSCAINANGITKLRSWLHPDTCVEVFNEFIELAETLAFDSLVLTGCTSEIPMQCGSEELLFSVDDFDWFVEIEVKEISSPPVKINDGDMSF